MRTVILRNYTVIYDVFTVLDFQSVENVFVWLYRLEPVSYGPDGGLNSTENISLGVSSRSSVDFSFYRFRRNGSVYGEVTVIVTEFSVNRKLRP
jgi:hypothetical protein